MSEVRQEELDSYEAKEKLPQILRREDAGTVFTFANRGKPDAYAIPAQSRSALQNLNY